MERSRFGWNVGIDHRHCVSARRFRYSSHHPTGAAAEEALFDCEPERSSGHRTGSSLVPSKSDPDSECSRTSRKRKSRNLFQSCGVSSSIAGAIGAVFWPKNVFDQKTIGEIIMNDLSRRRFLQTASGSAAGFAASRVALAPGASVEDPKESAKFRLGIVTYNIAAQWDLPTILRV